jgi:hypothetical protein
LAGRISFSHVSGSLREQRAETCPVRRDNLGVFRQLKMAGMAPARNQFHLVLLTGQLPVMILQDFLDAAPDEASKLDRDRISNLPHALGPRRRENIPIREGL